MIVYFTQLAHVFDCLIIVFAFKGGKSEKLVSGSDDFTLFLWEPGESKKPLARMTGGDKLVFSRDLIV